MKLKSRHSSGLFSFVQCVKIGYRLMIQDLLQWLHLANLSAAVEARRVSDLILIAYIVSFKRSWLFAMAFVICEIFYSVNFFGQLNSLPTHLYALSYYVTICFVWCVTVKSQINHTQNKSLAFWSSIMISFLLLMAWDSVANAETETYIYSNYALIIVCIHFCIILSLYNIRAGIYNLVSKLRSAISIIRSGYAMQFICYNAIKYKL